jgi:autotransporter adhesin
MNKSYKSVWNESTGSWVAVSELATGRSKSKRAKTAISKAILTQIAIGGMSLAGASVAMADPVVSGTVNVANGVAIGTDSEVDADPANASKTGGVAIGDSSYALGSGVAVGQNSSAGSDSLAFGSNATAANGGTAIGANAYSINNGGVAIGQAASATGAGALALGMNSSASGSGSVALGQDSVATDKNTVSVGNATTQRKIVNLAAGTSATDAVNVGQLTAAGLSIDTTGKATNSFVAYTGTTKDLVTLGGTAGTKLSNVKAGTTAMDAVNVAQLNAMGGTVDSNGNVTNAFVAYDSTAKTGVTLGSGTAGAQIHNLVAGTTGTDAVNVDQLSAATNGLSGVVTASKYIGISKAMNGDQAQASGTNAMSLGGNAVASADNSLAFGTNARALATNSVAIGTGSMTREVNTVSVGTSGGERRIVNVATGTNDTDAVNLGQMDKLFTDNGLKTTADFQSTQLLKSSTRQTGLLGASLLGAVTPITLDQVLAVGPTDKLGMIEATGTDAVAIGLNTHATNNYSVAIGSNVNSLGVESVSVGYGTSANGTDAASFGSKASVVADRGLAMGNFAAVNTGATDGIAIGSNAAVGGTSAIAVGLNSAAGGVQSLAFGVNASSLSDGAIVLGNSSKVSAVNSISVGSKNTVTGANSVVLGNNNTKVTGSNSVVLGNGSDGTQSNVVSVGGVGTERKIVNAAAGVINTDVVNVGQLKAAGLTIGTDGVPTNSFVAYDAGGTTSVTLGTGTVGAQIHQVVAGSTASDAVNLGQMTAAIASAAGSPLSVNYDSTSKDSITLGNGTKGAQIHQVVAGTADTDALNVGQLKAAGITIGTDGKPTNSFVAYDAGGTTSITLGTGTTGAQIHNLVAGTADTDAINLSQLNALGAKIGSDGKPTNSFVAYDAGGTTSVTLGTGTVGAQIHQVVAGTTGTDAINLNQLNALGAQIGSDGKPTNSFVAYDAGGTTSVTLGTGTVGAQIHNLVAGTADTDAINLGQLNALGAQIGSDGKPTNSFVAYDAGGTTSVTLGTGTVGAQIHQVVAGTADTDALNVGQLKAAGIAIGTDGKPTNAFVAYTSTAEDLVSLGKGTAGSKITQLKAGSVTASSTDAINGAQLFAASAATAAALGGNSTQDANGNVVAPAIKVGDTTYNTIAGAITAAADLAATGSTDGVKYDSTAHDLVTFGTAGKAVTLSNVAQGVKGTDAVNVDQLTAAGLAIGTDGKPTNSFVAYDAGGTTSITLGTGTTGAQIHNLVAGTADTDAINLGQLNALGAKIGSDGKPTNSFVAYDAGGTTSVTLGTGTVGAQIHNLMAGTTGTDAINLSQLNALGATIGTDGKPTNSFVAYDSGKGTTSVTLGTGTVGAQIHQVVAGTADTDAINLAQLNAATASSTLVGLSLKYVRFGASDAPFAQASGTDSMALGGNSIANATDALAIGTNARAFATNSVALGAGSITNDANTVSVGTQFLQRRITNVADGTDANDAVNLGQVEAMINKPVQTTLLKSAVRNSGLLGASSTGTLTPDQLIMSGPTDKIGMIEATGQDAIAIGLNTHATADNTVAIGTNVNAVGSGAVAMGNSTFANGLESTAIGVKANVIADHALAVGYMATGETVNSIAIGANSQVGGAAVGGVAIGNTNMVSGAGSMLLGNSTTVSGTNTFVMGSNIKSVAGNNSVVLGSGSDGSQSNVVSVGAKGTERRIVNVAEGTTTTDAVNLGQMTTAIAAASITGGGDTFVTQPTAGTGDLLVGAAVAGTHVNFANSAGTARELIGVAAGTTATSAVNLSQLTPVVDALGGGAKVDPTTGAVTGPKYSVQGGNQSTVADALTALDGGVNAINTKIANVGPSLVTQSAAGADLMVGSTVDGTHVNFANNAGVARELINVANGTTATSAVNLSQLTPVVAALGGGAAIDKATGAVTGPSYTIGGHTTTNAGDAFKDVDGSLTNLTNSVAAITADSGGLGLVAQTGTTGNITVGALSGGTVVDLTNSSGVQRKLTGVAAGDVSSSSFDAINGSQLFSTGSGIATAIGGGAMMNADGSFTQPSFSVGGSTVHNVGDAITNLDGRTTSNANNLIQLQDQVTNITAGGGVATPNAVAYDSSAHDTLTLASTAGGTTKLSGLTDGSLAAGSTDAVTGNQLNATNADVAALQTSVQNIASTGSTSIGLNGADGAAGTAGAAGANGADAIAMGDNASASGDHAIVIGGGATATGDGTIAIGGNAGASGTDSIAIGNGATAPANNAVALGANSVADRDNSVSVGSADQQYAIHQRRLSEGARRWSVDDVGDARSGNADRHLPGKQRVVFIDGICKWQPLKQPGEITIGIDAVGAAGLHD